MRLKRKGMAAGQPDSAAPRPDSNAAHATVDACGCRHDSLPTVESLAQDAAEIVLVYLCRHAFGALCEGDARYWCRGFDMAVETFGEDRGLAVFTRLISLARQIQADRLGTFNFQSVNCSRMAPDEESVLDTIQKARGNNLGAFQKAACTLANGGRPDRIGAAAQAIGTMLNIFEMEEAYAAESSHVSTGTRH